MDQIERRHLDLARDLGLHVEAELDRHFTELRRSAEGIHLIGEVSDRLRARVMANGELMATRIGAAFLQAEGIDTQWVDARTLLHAEERPNATERASYLSATCSFEPDAGLQQRLADVGKVLITQGFIASDEHGDTVLLGRGGSDTSGSLFRGQARGPPARDLDRRAGHVHRQPALGAECAPAEVSSTTTRRRRSRAAAPRCCIRAASCRCAVLDPADRPCHADARARRHGGHRQGRRRRGARQGGLRQEGHHAAVAGNARHVAPGGFPGRCVRGVQGSRPVGRPRLHLGDQRHGLAGPGRQLARRPRARGAGGRRCRSCAASRSSDPARPSAWSAAASAPRCTAWAMRWSCSRSSASTWSRRRPTTSTSPSWSTRSRATVWCAGCTT